MATKRRKPYQRTVTPRTVRVMIRISQETQAKLIQRAADQSRSMAAQGGTDLESYYSSLS